MPNNLLFIGELLSGGKQFKPKMDELACFLPGAVALAVHHGALPKAQVRGTEEVARVVRVMTWFTRSYFDPSTTG